MKAGGALLGLASIPVSAYQGYQQGGPLSAAQSVGYSAIDAAVNFTLATSAVGIPGAVAYTQSGGSKAMLSGAQVGVAMQACAGSFSFAPGG